MRRLMLLRHAKTETDAPSGRDQDRRLDDRGRQDAAEIGGWISRHPPFPDLVLVSPAIRAHQTWEIAWEAMKNLAPQPQVEFLPELYGADPTHLLQTIRDGVRVRSQAADAGRAQSGHARTGAGADRQRRRRRQKRRSTDNLPTSGLAIFDFAIDDWNEVAFRRGKLVLFVSPKLLKQASGD